jgi:hypothetical protein
MNSNGHSRRHFLRISVTATIGAMFPSWSKAESGPSAEIIEMKVISLDVENYHGWPTLIRRKNGQLWLVCSGGREAHVCPFGRVELMVSHDQGANWTYPRTLLDTDIDDRDAGIVETAAGTLLVTTFTSLAYEPALLAAERAAAGSPDAWPAPRLARWQSVHRRLGSAEREAELGQWMIRSTDGGRTWSPRYSCIVDSPHGPIQLADGRLLYAGKELWTGAKRVGVCESLDDGQSWRWLAEIPVRPGDNASDYHELHAVEAKAKHIIVQIRNHNTANANETLQTESEDGGKTWSVPHEIGVWGLPSHLLRLQNGWLLMTYGHRRTPLGNQARVSTDEGRTWSSLICISADGSSGDLGYPSTAELDDGTLVTVWYEKLQNSSAAVLRQARWKLRGVS